MKKIILLLTISVFMYACKGDSASLGPISSIGQGGSTARFTIANDYLYIVDNQSLKVFNILDSGNPTFIKRIAINTIVETIFPFNNFLLIGTQNGMYIFDITTPDSPQFVSIYAHIVSCDPAVAEGNYAYVTLRSGTNCNRGVNVLEVINIKDLKNPSLIKAYQMKSPHGLGVDANLLFVTEGDYGLKVFDKSNPNELKEIKNFNDISAMDVIADKNMLIITGNDGVYQYSYNAQNELKLLSKINIEL